MTAARYSPEYLSASEKRLIEFHRYMCEHEFGQLQVNYNRHEGRIEFVPSPHVIMRDPENQRSRKGK